MSTDLKEIALHAAVELAGKSGMDAKETVSAADAFYAFLTGESMSVNVTLRDQQVSAMVKKGWDLGFEAAEGYHRGARRK